MSHCSSTFGRVQSLAQGMAAPARQLRKGRPAPRAGVVPAAAATPADTTDIRSLLLDALEVPVAQKSDPVPASPAAVAVEAPPAAGPVPDLPGTEILPSPIPTAVPDVAAPPTLTLPDVQPLSKVQGFDYDALKAQMEAAAPKAVPKVPAAASEDAAAAAAAAGKQLSAAADALGSTTSAAVSQASEAASQAAGAVTGAVSSAASVLTEGVGGAASALGGTVGAAAGAAGEAASAATTAVSGAAARVSAVFDEEVSIIKANLESATSAVQSSVAAAEAAVGSAVGGVVDTLPPPVKDALYAAGAAASDAAQLAAASPQAAAVVTGVSVGVPALLLWRAAFGGYAGNLAPQEAMDVLQGQGAVLVDVRTEAQRLQDGIAELRRGALGKGAAVPPVQLLPSVAKRVRNAEALALEIIGSQIAGLAKVGSNTKIIVMDNQGERAKAIARAASAEGLRAYVLQGGFRGWKAAGLAVQEKAVDYEASVAVAVADQVEFLAEVSSAKLSQLKDPKNAVPVAAGVLALSYAALNFHTVLQFIGVLSLEVTLLLKVLSYDSPEQAFEELEALLESAQGAISSASALLPAGSASASAAGQQRQQQQGGAKPAAPPAKKEQFAFPGGVANSDDE